MIGIYDNGDTLLGRVSLIREYTREHTEKFDEDREFLIELLEDIKDLDEDTIVAVNYENQMGYTIEFWKPSDRLKGV